MLSKKYRHFKKREEEKKRVLYIFIFLSSLIYKIIYIWRKGQKLRENCPHLLNKKKSLKKKCSNSFLREENIGEIKMEKEKMYVENTFVSNKESNIKRMLNGRTIKKRLESKTSFKEKIYILENLLFHLLLMFR